MAHICNRESCLYGISTTTTAQWNACDKTGEKIEHFSSTSNIQFHCNACLTMNTPSQSLNDSVSMTPRTEKTTIKGIMQEVTKLQDQLANFLSNSMEMNDKLDSIDTKTNDIDLKTNEIKSNTLVVLEKVVSKPANNGNTPFVFGTPSTRQFRPQLHRNTMSWAAIAAANGNGSNTTPSRSAKRPRHDKQLQQLKPNVPAPKIGTNANVGRLVAVEKPAPRKIAEKPKYEKAVWISRLPPTTSEDDVREYIGQLSSVSSNLIVHKLVKKDRDCSELNFVSFKIAVNNIDFAILNDPSVWPKGVLVREFMEIKPVTFGDCLPTNLNEKNSRKTPEESSDMDIQHQSPNKSTNTPQENS